MQFFSFAHAELAKCARLSLEAANAEGVQSQVVPSILFSRDFNRNFVWFYLQRAKPRAERAKRPTLSREAANKAVVQF